MGAVCCGELWIYQKRWEARCATGALGELKAVASAGREEAKPWERMAWGRRQPRLGWSRRRRAGSAGALGTEGGAMGNRRGCGGRMAEVGRSNHRRRGGSAQ